MAQVKFSGPVAAVSGTIGGTVYARNRYGPYARNWAKPVNPNTDLQVQVRGNLVAQSQLWRGLSQENRNTWADYAAATPRVNRLGDTVFWSGFTWFCSTNLTARSLGQDVREVAPGEPGLLPAIVVTPGTITLYDNGDINAMTITTYGALGIEDAVVGLYAGIPVSAGVSFYKGPWKFITGLTGASPTPTEIAGGNYGPGTTAGYAVALKLTAYNPNTGQIAPETILQPTVITEAP